MGIQAENDETYPVTGKSVGVQGMIFSIYPVSPEAVGIGIGLLRKIPSEAKTRDQECSKKIRFIP